MTIDKPNNPLVQMEVDETSKAGRVSLSPVEFRSGSIIGSHNKGSWRTGLVTGVAANGGIFSMRWGNNQYKFLLQKLEVTAFISTVFAAAQELSLDLAHITSFSAGDTGGTQLDPLLKLHARDVNIMGPSLVQTLRIATVGALTLGTGTVDGIHAEDAFPLSTVTLGSVGKITLYEAIPGDAFPESIHANEGFRIRILQAMGAGGVVVFHVNMEWAEVPEVA